MQPLVELHRPFILDHGQLESIDRGACDADLDAVRDASRALAVAEDSIVFDGLSDAGIAGIGPSSPHEPIALSDSFGDYPNHVAKAVAILKGAGIAGPYAIALGPRCYAGVIETTEKGGYPVLHHLGLILGGPVVWAPAVDGALVISQHGRGLRVDDRAGRLDRLPQSRRRLGHLYESLGTAFAERLRGMFGIVLWDRNRRRTVLVRDRLGIKPLYYAVVGDLLVFASELKSLLASGLIGDELDHEAIDAYLTFGFFPAPATPLRQVRKLEPGHRLIVDPEGYRIERYWAYPEPSDDPISRDPREMTEALFDELDEAVRLRLMSDVPLGAMLSGGLDSSLIVAMMARHSTAPVKTFAVGFRGEGR